MEQILQLLLGLLDRPEILGPILAIGAEFILRKIPKAPTITKSLVKIFGLLDQGFDKISKNKE